MSVNESLDVITVFLIMECSTQPQGEGREAYWKTHIPYLGTGGSGQRAAGQLQKTTEGKVIKFISIHIAPIRQKGTASVTGLVKHSPGDFQKHEDP